MRVLGVALLVPCMLWWRRWYPASHEQTTWQAMSDVSFWGDHPQGQGDGGDSGQALHTELWAELA